jgi:hypothetical protein
MQNSNEIKQLARMLQEQAEPIQPETLPARLLPRVGDVLDTGEVKYRVLMVVNGKLIVEPAGMTVITPARQRERKYRHH